MQKKVLLLDIIGVREELEIILKKILIIICIIVKNLTFSLI